jgi:hypothetical protein
MKMLGCQNRLLLAVQTNVRPHSRTLVTMKMSPYQNRLLRAVQANVTVRLGLHPRTLVTATPLLAESDAAQALSTPINPHPSVIKANFRKLLQEEREKSLLGGGQDRIDKQHARGSLTARERLELLFDNNSFRELDALKSHRCTEFGMGDRHFPGDGIITGHGLINGRVVYAFRYVSLIPHTRHRGLILTLMPSIYLLTLIPSIY